MMKSAFVPCLDVKISDYSIIDRESLTLISVNALIKI